MEVFRERKSHVSPLHDDDVGVVVGVVKNDPCAFTNDDVVTMTTSFSHFTNWLMQDMKWKLFVEAFVTGHVLFEIPSDLRNSSNKLIVHRARLVKNNPQQTIVRLNANELRTLGTFAGDLLCCEGIPCGADKQTNKTKALYENNCSASEHRALTFDDMIRSIVQERRGWTSMPAYDINMDCMSIFMVAVCHDIDTLRLVLPNFLECDQKEMWKVVCTEPYSDLSMKGPVIKYLLSIGAVSHNTLPTLFFKFDMDSMVQSVNPNVCQMCYEWPEALDLLDSLLHHNVLDVVKNESHKEFVKNCIQHLMIAWTMYECFAPARIERADQDLKSTWRRVISVMDATTRAAMDLYFKTFSWSEYKSMMTLYQQHRCFKFLPLILKEKWESLDLYCAVLHMEDVD